MNKEDKEYVVEKLEQLADALDELGGALSDVELDELEELGFDYDSEVYQLVKKLQETDNFSFPDNAAVIQSAADSIDIDEDDEDEDDE